MGPEGHIWEPISATDTEQAAYWNLGRLAEARQLSRQLVDENGFAANAIENRISYIIGAGHTYRVDPAPAVADNDPTPARVAEFLASFRDRNQWYERQLENCRRFDRDGETILRLFTDAGGETVIRYVDPEWLRPTAANANTAPLGIETEPGDAETPLHYWINEEPVDAADIQHRKHGVDFNVLRGIPLLWPIRRNLRRAALMLRNMSALVEVQTSIALIRKHRGTSNSGIETFADGQSQATRTNPANGHTERYGGYGPGTILDVPAGREYEFPNIGLDSSRIVEPLRAELRAAAARLVMPEFMFTSDASNAAYASTMVAEGPAVRTFERLQCGMIHADLTLMRTIVSRGAAAGALPEDALQKCVISAEAPHVQVRDFLKLNTVHKIAHAAGILSPQTWAQKLQLDYNREQQQIRQHRATPGADPTPDPPSRTPPANDPPPSQSPYNP